jgi:hypothetical protein
MANISVLITLAVVIVQVKGKIYSDCELLDELFEKHNATVVDAEELLCIAKSTGLDTAYSEDGGTFGIFNISKTMDKACNISSTSQLTDDDISDDYSCALKALAFNNFDPFSDSEDCFGIVDDCYKQSNATDMKSDDNVKTPIKSNETKSSNFDDESEELSIKPVYTIQPLPSIPKIPPENPNDETIQRNPRPFNEHLNKIYLINEFAEKNRNQKVNIFFVFV